MAKKKKISNEQLNKLYNELFGDMFKTGGEGDVPVTLEDYLNLEKKTEFEKKYQEAKAAKGTKQDKLVNEARERNLKTSPRMVPGRRILVQNYDMIDSAESYPASAAVRQPAFEDTKASVPLFSGRRHARKRVGANREVWASRDPLVAELFALGHGAVLEEHMKATVQGGHLIRNPPRSRVGHVDIFNPKGFTYSKEAGAWLAEEGFVHAPTKEGLKPIGGYWVKWDKKTGRPVRINAGEAHMRRGYSAVKYSQSGRIVRRHPYKTAGVVLGGAALAGGGIYAYRHREDIKKKLENEKKSWAKNKRHLAKKFNSSKLADRFKPYYYRRQNNKRVRVRNSRRK